MKCNKCSNVAYCPADFYERDDWFSLIIIIIGALAMGFIIGLFVGGQILKEQCELEEISYHTDKHLVCEHYGMVYSQHKWDECASGEYPNDNYYRIKDTKKGWVFDNPMEVLEELNSEVIK